METHPEGGEDVNKAKGIKGLILGAIMIVLIGGYYLYLSNRNAPEEEETETFTLTQEALTRDLERSYPPSPKEVLKYYNDLTMCFYNEEHEAEELAELARQARRLYDDELLANQTEEQYIQMLAEDVASYQEEETVISSYSVSNSVDVEYYDRDGYEWAKLYCIVTLRKGTQLGSTQEDFLLRKDADGHWKIYGWIVSPKDAVEDTLNEG